MQQIIQILIYIHAFFGGLGLISGTISMVLKKGGVNHKKAGKLFSLSMLISSLLSLIIASMPQHENTFLFLIGVFTIYMVLAGNRALTFKNTAKTRANFIDKTISGSMLIASLTMVVLGTFGWIQHIQNSLLYVFFGAFGLLLTTSDFRTFKNFRNNNNAWLKSHLARMIGALIASFTAFLVAGLNISTLLVWMMPTVIGTAYILYWNRKLSSYQKLI